VTAVSSILGIDCLQLKQMSSTHRRVMAVFEALGLICFSESVMMDARLCVIEVLCKKEPNRLLVAGVILLLAPKA